MELFFAKVDKGKNYVNWIQNDILKLTGLSPTAILHLVLHISPAIAIQTDFIE